MRALVERWETMPQRTSLAVSRYLMRIYFLMSMGIAVSAGTAMLVVDDGVLRRALFPSTGMSGLVWGVMLAPVLLVITVNAGVRHISARRARALFFLYAVLVGLSLGAICYAAIGQSLAPTLLAIAAAFFILALFSWTSGADFSPFGAFLTLGLMALLFLMATYVAGASQMLDIMLSAAAIVLFAALTAFDLQRLKRLYLDEDVQTATVGALTLYLDFVNMFLSLLRFNRRARR